MPQIQPSSIQRCSQRRLTVVSTLDAPGAHAQPPLPQGHGRGDN